MGEPLSLYQLSRGEKGAGPVKDDNCKKMGLFYYNITVYASRARIFKLLNEIFDFCFFHDSVSPKPLSVPLRPFRIFSKIRRYIRSSRCTTGVLDTGGKWTKSSIRKMCNISFEHLWVVEFFLQVHFKVSAV
jgi:hypothetical protein